MQANQNRGESRKKIVKYALIALLLLGVGLKLYFTYFGYIYYHYIAPPGYDVIPHYRTIKTILETGAIHFTSYPPLFHLIVIALSKVFHVGAFSILTYWTPAMVVLPPLAVFFLLRQFFGLKVSVLVTVLFLLASNYPMFAFVDGNYPDILAYGVFTPLMVGFLFRYFRLKKRINLILTAVFLVAIALTHHLTLAIVGAILVIFGLIQLYLWAIEKGLKFNKKTILAAIGVIAIIILGTYALSALYGGLLNNFIGGVFTGQPALRNDYLNQTIEFTEYPNLMGGLVWYLGILGFMYMLITGFVREKNAKMKQFVIVWLLVVYILSRLDSTGIPGRFARELAIPLVICIAYLFDYILNLNRAKLSSWKVAFGYGLLGYVVIINSQLYMGLAKLPDSFSDLVWFWPKDQQKVDYLAQNVPKDTPILYNARADLFIPIKSANKLEAIELSQDEINLVAALIASPENGELKLKYESLLKTIREKYINEKYVFIDVKPPSNPNGSVYYHYAYFEMYDKVLRDFTKEDQVLKTFSDGALLVELDHEKS